MEPFEYQPHMPDKVACMSGDADRLIYFKRTSGSKIPTIVDGDKNFCLLMLYIKTQLENIGLPDLDHIYVNTPFANSKCNQYLENNEINHVCIPGGVSKAEPEARKHIIGAYVESNGQGAIFVSWEELNK